MQAGIDRRAPGAPRAPLDLLVQLEAPPSGALPGDGRFDADSVDVSPGGLALRADRVPRIGQRLLCRFDCPPDDTCLEVLAEVVWTRATPEGASEFGLCFVELDAATEARLRRLVDTVRKLLDAPAARMWVDGVDAAIEANVTQRSAQRLTLEQALPCLRLGAGVFVDQRPAPHRGRLVEVSLEMRDQTPSLVLKVESIPDDACASDIPEPTQDETSDDRTLQDAHPWIVTPEVDEPATSDFTTATRSRPVHAAGAAADERAISPTSHAEQARVQPSSAPDHSASGRSESGHSESGHSESGHSESGHSESGHPESDRSSPRTAPKGHFAPPASPTGHDAIAWDAGLIARGRAAAAPLAGAAAAMRHTVTAHARAWATRLATSLKAWGAEAAPKLARLWALCAAQLVSLANTLRARAARRRTTARAPRRPAPPRRRRQQRPSMSPPVANLRRSIVVGCLGALGVATAVYALTPSGEQSAAEVGPHVSEAALPGERAAAQTRDDAPAPAAAYGGSGAAALPPAPNPSPTGLNSAGLPATALPATGDGADAMARTQPGPLALPSYPSLDRGILTARATTDRATTARATTGAGRTKGGHRLESFDKAQAAAEAGGEKASSVFGDGAIPEGPTYTIRMSQPIRAMRGHKLSDGFTVLIPGSLALTKAGPIARAHPLVSRSMIINRGSEALLTIQFVAGSAPGYQVRAVGRSLSITIARQ